MPLGGSRGQGGDPGPCGEDRRRDLSSGTNVPGKVGGGGGREDTGQGRGVGVLAGCDSRGAEALRALGSCAVAPRALGGCGPAALAGEGRRCTPPAGGQCGCGGGEGWVLRLTTPFVWAGTPKPQVTWRKGPTSEPLLGRPGLAVLDGGSLFLASVSPTDGGDYECQATNEAGSASRRAKLVVYGEQGPQAGQLSRTSSCCRAHWRGGCPSACGWGGPRALGQRQMSGQPPAPERHPPRDSVRGRTWNPSSGFKMAQQ